MTKPFKLLTKILALLLLTAGLILAFTVGPSYYAAYQNKQSLNNSVLAAEISPGERTQAASLANGEILSKTPFQLADIKPLWDKFSENDTLKAEYRHLEALNFFSLVYKSDGQLVNGIVAEPKAEGKFPVILFNRGGNQQRGAVARFKTLASLLYTSGHLASRGYVLLASCYRENDEFGGRDIQDVLSLTQTAQQLPKADPERIGMLGWSRGGMMTYLALKHSDRIKTAVVGNGPTDLRSLLRERPEMDTEVCAKLIPDFQENRVRELEQRSVVYWANELDKDASLLILCGSNDQRVNPRQAHQLADTLSRIDYNFTLKEFETDHRFSGKTQELNRVLIDWFDQNL